MFWMVQHLWITLGLAGTVALLPVVAIPFLGRFYPHAETRSHFTNALITVALTLLLFIPLTHIFALNRDRGNRLKSLRDHHFGQLKPILLSESAKMQSIEEQVKAYACLPDPTRTGVVTNSALRALIWPEVMSSDLKQHFSNYDESKNGLFKELEAQDEEFLTAVQDAENEIKPLPDLVPYWKKVVAVSAVEQCMGRGEGVKLVLTDSAYTFSYFGGSSSASGGPPPPRPSPDQVAATNAFTSFKVGRTVTSHCESLNRRAESIISTARELSKKALLLSEGTILKGDCEFVQSNSLDD